MYSFKSQPKEKKKKKEEQRIRLNQVHTGPYMLVIIPLDKTTEWHLRLCTRYVYYKRPPDFHRVDKWALLLRL